MTRPVGWVFGGRPGRAAVRVRRVGIPSGPPYNASMIGERAAGHARVGRSYEQRVDVEVHYRPNVGSSLAKDALEGLTSRPKTLPPKYFYDTLGSRLFDEICDTEEYYPTRTERALLHQHADDIIGSTAPECIVELGSGAARKTRKLFDAVARAGRSCVYVPFDVGEQMLRSSALSLVEQYPWLEVRGVVADYEHQLDLVPTTTGKLVMFMGSTLGNFAPLRAHRFLRAIRERMLAGDWFLLGLDLVKDHDVLHAAYNDARGITARFNKNVLSVLNRHLDADFQLDQFRHVARYNAEDAQIEMYLEAMSKQSVQLNELGLSIELEREERILTEISRKFTRASAFAMLRAAGFEPARWYTPEGDYFAVALCRPIG